MAVLNKIRQRSVFLIIIIALALFSFVLADVIRSGGFSSQKEQNTIATINGEDVDRADFARKVESISRNSAGTSTIQAVNYVWNDEVRRVVFEEQFNELGIQVGADQVREMLEEALANNPTFQNDAGVFDKAKMQEYIASIQETSPQAYQQWLDYEASIEKQAREQIYFNMIKAASGATLKDGELAYKMENDKVDIKYVQLPYSSVAADEVTVSDADIKAYIQKHSDQFKSEATRSISYVRFNEDPSEADEKATEADVAKLLNGYEEYNSSSKTTEKVAGLKETADVTAFVNANSDIKFNDNFVFKNGLPKVAADTIYALPVGSTYGPFKDGKYYKVTKVVAERQMADSAKASHILISWEGLNTAGETKRTEEEAKKLADSLLTIVKTDKTKFADFAKEYSADNSNKDKGGDLGYFTPGRMVKPFNDFVFENKVGDMEVVKTAFGYHIIDIAELKNEQRAIKVATIAKKIEPSEKTINDIFTATTKFQIEAGKSNFQEAAKAENYSVLPVNKMKEMDENIPGVGAQRGVVQWAFNEDTKKGEIKRFEIPNGYIVAQVTAKAPKGLTSVKDAEILVKPILEKEKKAAILKAKISGSTLDDIAKTGATTVKTASALNMKTPTISGAGTEPVVVGTAFALAEGKVSKPIQGNNGVYVIEVTKKTPATALDSYKGFANQTGAAQAAAVNSKVFNALKDAAQIEDKRAKFY
ncbi:peptidylprolyl isomerase [Aquimarina rhabdastrellae]